MNIIEVWETIEALRKAKAEMVQAFQNAKDGEENETHLGVLAILACECAEYHELYQKEAAELPEPEGAEW